MIQGLLHSLLGLWFGWVENWGYAGVFLLMAMESSIIPVPSEIVMPPAAFWAMQGRMSLSGVILAGTLGSYFGSIANYGLAKWLGWPLLNRHGRRLGFTPEKLAVARNWIHKFGAPGVFAARLLPVVRHLISIPAGAFEMPFIKFSIATITGAGIWCAVLSWYGAQIIGTHPELLQSPEAMMSVIKGQLHWLVAGVVGVGLLYALMIKIKNKNVAILETPSA